MSEAWCPPSPYAEVDGYLWLPRMLAKARRAREDALGEYFVFGASGLDSIAMFLWGVNEARFKGWLDEGLDDAAIAAHIAELAGHKDLAARQAWSRRFRFLNAAFLEGLEAEEGRMPAGLRRTVMMGFISGVFQVVKTINRVRGLA